MVQPCNCSTLGGRGRQITCSQEFEISLTNMVNPVSTKNTKISQVQWQVPIIPATQEAEAGESLCLGGRGCSEPRIAPLHSSLGDIERLYLKKEQQQQQQKLNRTWIYSLLFLHI